MKNIKALTRINSAEDIFKAKDAGEIDLSSYVEVECLFCDSSGFGQSWEPALTKEQAIDRVDEIIDTNPDTVLYAAITGIGQFQVYVSILTDKIV